MSGAFKLLSTRVTNGEVAAKVRVLTPIVKKPGELSVTVAAMGDDRFSEDACAFAGVLTITGALALPMMLAVLVRDMVGAVMVSTPVAPYS